MTQMGYRTKLRIVIDMLKDKASLLRTTLSARRRISSIRRVILRATTHGAFAPPSDRRIAAVLSLGNGSRATACACVQVLMDRLHGTRNASVALKCLYIIHHVLERGSFILKDQLSVYPCSGGRNFLNLSRFRDDSNHETWEISSWVRWYAGVLEQNLMVSRVLGYQLCSSSGAKNDKDEKVSSLLNLDLIKDMDVLVDFAEQIGEAPDSLYLQSNSLVYDVMRLVGDDYRLAQREILLRVAELRERTASLSFDDLTQLHRSLERFEECRERLTSLFGNRKKNDDLWDLVRETKTRLVSTTKEKMQGKLMVIRREGGTLFRLASGGGWLGGRRLGADRVPLPAPTIG